MAKCTAVAAANIALIKYWGMQDADRVWPTNPSISMTLRHCVSRSTVETIAGNEDEVLYLSDDGVPAPADAEFAAGVLRHLQRMRVLADRREAMRVATVNNFPTGAGIASSASGFAALTMAAAGALELQPDAPQLSRWARMSGSGSAARSILGGFVQWPGDAGDPDAPAQRIFDRGHWPLRDLIVVVDREPKEVSSREGHRRALTSPYYSVRQTLLPRRAERVRQALATRDFRQLAEAVEEEAIDLHLIAMSSRPPTFYWQAPTLTVLHAVRQLREGGMEVCATIDAGPNVHVLCTPRDADRAFDVLCDLPGVVQVIADEVGSDAHYDRSHLI